MHTHRPDDVRSRINLKTMRDAKAWADSANTKRPWRETFFRAMGDELTSLRNKNVSILELGSGPGFLAQHLTDLLPNATYILYDFSRSMHKLARKRLTNKKKLTFITGDFRSHDWANDLPKVDAVVTMQAVHELRNKAYAATLHAQVRDLLRDGGVYLVCDHVAGTPGMENPVLFMTLPEQARALEEAGFLNVKMLLELNGLVLHRATRAT